MAANKEEPKKSGFKFQAVTTTVPVAGGANRESAGGTAHKSGRLVLNTEATELWAILTHKFAEPEKVAARFGADSENVMVAAYPVMPGAPGVMPTRRVNKSLNVSMHLAGVFKDHPNLRPSGKRQVTVWSDVDADGKECLIIALQTALTKRTGTRAANAPIPATQG